MEFTSLCYVTLPLCAGVGVRALPRPHLYMAGIAFTSFRRPLLLGDRRTAIDFRHRCHHRQVSFKAPIAFVNANQSGSEDETTARAEVKHVSLVFAAL